MLIKMLDEKRWVQASDTSLQGYQAIYIFVHKSFLGGMSQALIKILLSLAVRQEKTYVGLTISELTVPYLA